MSTTQILFNSPALHSLKRDQLVKLCKIHSVKASGKNKDLIARLRRHAKALPPDDPLSIATRGDNTGATPTQDSEDEQATSRASSEVSDISRPSEQWEVVMDTIAEVDEETLRSNRGASDRQVGEFGTTTSKASITSSLKTIATSLGLRRNTSKANGNTSSSSSLSSKEVIQSSSTLPTSDPNGGPEEQPAVPVPGQSNLQGFPAPSGARLSLTQAPTTTTIRLVSNPATNPGLLLSPPTLKPFATSFDLVPGTPGGAGTSSVPVWPFSPGGAARESLYPPIPTFEEFGDLNKSSRYDNSDMDIDVDMPCALAVPSIREPTPAKNITSTRFNTGATPKSTEKPSAEPIDIFSPAPKPQNDSTRSKLGVPRSQPFVFGSPLPQNNLSNLQFRSVAQSVLDEMNKRLAEEGVETVDTSVLDNRGTSTESSIDIRESSAHPRVGDIFEKIHQKEFDKMDSITSHYAAKRGAQGTVAQPILSKKRKSSLVVKEKRSGVPPARNRPNGSRVISVTSVKTLPGGFGEEGDEDEDLAERRLSKRPRVERDESDAPAQPEKPPVAAPPPDPEEEAQKHKEREAIRRRLEHNKAKRRSSMGRPSLGRAPPSKPARFGFLATAKSLVQNVWNRGAGSKASSNIPATKPAQPKEETKARPKTVDAKKSAAVPGSFGAPPLSSQTKHVPSGSSSKSTQFGVPSRSGPAPPVVSGESGTAASSRIWKSPTPSVNIPCSSAAANSRSSTITGNRQSNNRGSSFVGFSSLGTKPVLSADNTSVASLGAKSSIRASAANVQKHTTTIPRSRTLSTLMAPTASSLAKTSTHSRIPVSAAPHENATLPRASSSSKQRLATSPLPSATLEQITTSPKSPVQSARPGKVFSQPLSPPPVRPPMSLTSAATSIFGQGPKETSSLSSKLPRAKVLPGRRPRISRSKVIARLASQRTAGTSSGEGGTAGVERAGGKVRSSIGTQVAGKTRQSYGGTRGSEMSAKKRVRQSEYARRTRAIMGEGSSSRMDVD